MDFLRYMKIGIIGSRHFGDLSRVSSFVRDLHGHYGSSLVIVSGGAQGVDRAAENEAKDLGIPRIIHHPKPVGTGIVSYAKAAYARNTLIVQDSGLVFAFWSFGRDSTGTLDTMIKALQANKLAGIFHTKHSFILNGLQGLPYLESR